MVSYDTDMKHLWAYSIPVIGILGIYFSGIYSFAALIFAFVIIPVMELMLPTNEENYDEAKTDERLKN